MKVLVIGDSCKDIYLYGNADRICPDAPVPVFVPSFRRENKGMAGNVYENLMALGADCSLITNKDEITKTRYVEEKSNHIIVRVDSGEEKIKKIDNLHLIQFEQYDAVAISDYNKGFLSQEDIAYIAKHHPITFLDTKKFLGDWAKDIKFIKINEIEYNNTKPYISDKKWLHEKLIITVGSKGCKFRNNLFPVKKVEIKDLSGAGDTFLAALAFKYVQTSDIDESVTFANECATQVVQKKGVTTLNDV
jgi:D-beta-D-heptose 7-phosphate kinase/D-beta-D-heptose 1-phosphate adenosyltransferase